MAKKNITVEELGAWDSYANKAAEEAIPEIYRRATTHSKNARKWYWDSWCGTTIGGCNLN